MAREEDDGAEQDEGLSTPQKVVAGAALGVVVPAAVGVARKLLSDGDDGESMVSKLKPGKSKSKRDTSSVLSSAASSAWESAQGVILPIADDAMAAAGKYLAEEAPDLVRERLVPKFIEAFNDAS